MLNNFYFKDKMYCSKMNKMVWTPLLTERILWHKMNKMLEKGERKQCPG